MEQTAAGTKQRPTAQWRVRRLSAVEIYRYDVTLVSEHNCKSQTLYDVS